MSAPISQTKEQILVDLKTRGPQTAASLARRFKVTAMAIRQHLAALEESRLVTYRDTSTGRAGRPQREWMLTESAQSSSVFPDSHAELTVGLIRATEKALGSKGLKQVISTRGKLVAREYAAQIPKDASLREKVRALAKIRDREGYMASWSQEKDGSYLLLENHCPICEAAKACLQFCSVELELFRTVLGPNVDVQREDYILEGGRRCSYRIKPG